jgi:hypothetical protein
MNCYVHQRVPAVGLCVSCQKALCPDCVGVDTPRLVCRTCLTRGATFGFEYRSPVTIAGWPLVHICTGSDPVSMQPRVARGVIAIGQVAIGGLAIGGVACGLFAIGGASFGVLLAVGGLALGLGLSIGGLAVGSIAVGGAAVGFVLAIGGGAFGPAVIDGRHCDPAARDLIVRWLGTRWLPPTCS